MNNEELEKFKLVERYYELKYLVTPLLGEEKSNEIFTDNLANCNNIEIKHIILKRLQTIERKISSGVFQEIVLSYYKDLINLEEPTAKIMKVRMRTMLQSGSKLLD